MADTSETVTLRVPREVRQRLDKLAKATARSKSWLALRAIESYLDLQEWQLQAIEKGVADADQGRLIQDDSVRQWLMSWGSEDERKPPR